MGSRSAWCLRGSCARAADARDWPAGGRGGAAALPGNCGRRAGGPGRAAPPRPRSSPRPLLPAPARAQVEPGVGLCPGPGRRAVPAGPVLRGEMDTMTGRKASGFRPWPEAARTAPAPRRAAGRDEPAPSFVQVAPFREASCAFFVVRLRTLRGPVRPQPSPAAADAGLRADASLRRLRPRRRQWPHRPEGGRAALGRSGIRRGSWFANEGASGDPAEAAFPRG